MDGLRRPPSISARSLAGALGLNLWVLALLVPIAFLHGAQPTVWVLSPLAPLCLAWGLRRRSSPALLLGVPIAALAAWALPELEPLRRHPAGFVIVAASLLSYTVAALRALEPPRQPSPIREAPTSAPAPPPRWLRRMRIYRGFVVATAALPTLLVYVIALHAPTVAALSSSYPGNVERAQALMIAVATLAFALVFATRLAQPLVGHLDHDIAVRVTAERSRLVARRGRPCAAFYLAVGCALALMATVMALRAEVR